MNLSFSNNLLNNKKFSNTSRANSSSAGQGASGVKGSGKDGLLTMSDLKPGQSFKAQIVDTNYNNVRLKLEDGQVISARIDSAGEFNTGEEITFTVKENDGVQLSISPSKIQTQVNPTLLNALTSAGLPTDAEHQNMVQRMMQEQLPIDKQSLQSMHRNILNNPSTPIDNLVLMTKFNIPITQENLYQFDAYKNYEHQITTELSNLADNLMDTLSALANEASRELAGPGSNGLEGFNSSNMSQVGNGLDNTMEALEFNKALLEIALDEGDSLNQAVSITEQNITNAEAINVGSEQISTNVEVANLSVEIAGTNISDIIEEANNQDQLQQLADTLKESGMSQELVDSVLKGEISDKDLLKEINNEINKLLDNRTNISDINTEEDINRSNLQQKDEINQSSEKVQSTLKNMEAARSIISDKGYQKLLSGAIAKQWFLSPKQVGQEGKVSNLYEKLDKQVKGLMDQLNKLGQEAAGKEGLEKAVANSSQSAGHASGNVDFMNQINQLYSFVQIPLKMNGQNAHSDLYVFTNKKNLADPEGEIKALLHLDMDALGSVDAFLKLQGQSLDTKFTLDNDETYELFEKHIDRLVTRLEAKGYSCKIQFEKGQEKVDFVEDFLKQGQSVGNLQRFSFDVKA